MTPELPDRGDRSEKIPPWLRTAEVETLSRRLFRRDGVDDAYPLWADGGVGETSEMDHGLAPCAHRLAVLPDEIWQVRTEDLAPRELVSWLRERLPEEATDHLYAVLLSYDAGRNLERIPATATEDPSLPEVVVARYPAWLESPGASGPWTLRGADPQAREALLEWLRPEPSPPPHGGVALHLESPMGPEAHERAVLDVLEGIRDGDLYQANVARRLECPMDPRDTPELYRRLRQNTPPAFGALWQLSGDLWLASVSPERLVTWEPESRTARSYPIKGTRPRSEDPTEDRRLAEELIADPKERAEHVMIVDLVRNDLGRVAVPGGVRVDRLCAHQPLPTVHHLVSDVRAEVRANLDLADILGALFPGGSITGAPKIAAMARIEKVEGLRRGFYTGSLGLVDGLTGRATFNILIRTCVVADGRLMYQTGGGIVADSDPAREWVETEVKASALVRSLQEASAGSQTGSHHGG